MLILEVHVGTMSGREGKKKNMLNWMWYSYFGIGTLADSLFFLLEI